MVLETKLNREIDNISKRQSDSSETLFNEAVIKINNVAKAANDDMSSIRSNLTYLESLISKKISAEDIKSLSNSVKEIRNSYESDTGIVMDHIRNLEDKYSEFGRRFSALESFSNNNKEKLTGDLMSKKPAEGHSEFNAESSIKLKLIDDRVNNLMANLEQIKTDLDNKADISELLKVENSKVTKEELLALLPSEESKDVLKEEFKSEIAYFHKSIDELARAWDLKLVKLRKEIDLYAIKKVRFKQNCISQTY